MLAAFRKGLSRNAQDSMTEMLARDFWFEGGRGPGTIGQPAPRYDVAEDWHGPSGAVLTCHIFKACPKMSFVCFLEYLLPGVIKQG